MSRGCWILGLVWGVLSSGHAMTWQDWWVSRDRQAQTLLHAGRFAQAAQTFQRADWRAAAAYRAGDYQQAAQNYLALQTIEGAYNAGNALAKLGQYQPAIVAYNQALAKNPKHQDALYNRALVQKLLDQQKQSQPSPQQQSSDQKKSPSSSPPPSKPAKSDANEKNQPQPSASDSAQSPVQSKPSEQAPQPKNTPRSASPKPMPPKGIPKATQQSKPSRAEREQQQANEQWLRLIPDDPGGLLREKFLRDHLKRQNEWSS